MLKTIAISAAVLLTVSLAVILILAAAKPDTFQVQRAASIKAPPEKIFPFIDDFRRWETWSPWEKKDPAMTRRYSGPASGKGAAYAWEGDKNVGKGRMEIAESAPPSRITLNLDFEKPFAAHNIVEFRLEPQGDATNVVWSMHGPTPYFAKIVHVFFDMDSMVGKDFETGLAGLKAAAEQ